MPPYAAPPGACVPRGPRHPFRPLLALVAVLLVGLAPRAAAQLDAAPQASYRGILVFGQSNMVGGNSGRDAGPGGLDSLPLNVYCLDRTDRIAPWHLPFPFAMANEESGTSDNVNAAMTFAARLAETYPQDRFCVLFCAHNASGFNVVDQDPERSWAAPPSPNYVAGNLFERAVARCATAAAQGVEVEFIVGLLGESDAASTEPPALAQEFRWLIDGFRQVVGPVPVVLGTMPQWDGTAFGDLAAVDSALVEVAATTPDTVLAWADGLVPPPGDINHFDAPSCRLHGERMFDALSAAGLIGPGEPAAGVPFTDAETFPPGFVGGAKGIVLHQDFTSGAWFQSFTDALSGGAVNRSQFSRIAEFEGFRRHTGEFMLRATWSNGESATWTQLSNPLTAPRDVVEGLSIVDDPQGSLASGLVGGLTRTATTGAVLSLRPGATSIVDPMAGLFLYTDYKVAQAHAFTTVLRTPLGLPATSITIEAL